MKMTHITPSLPIEIPRIGEERCAISATTRLNAATCFLGTFFHWLTAACETPHASAIALPPPRRERISLSCASLMHKSLIALSLHCKQIKDADSLRACDNRA